MYFIVIVLTVVKELCVVIYVDSIYIYTMECVEKIDRLTILYTERVTEDTCRIGHFQGMILHSIIYESLQNICILVGH